MNWAKLTINNSKQQSGQSLIELLIAMAILVLGVSVISFLVLDAFLADRAARERMLAGFFAQEGIEAVRSIRDSDFDNLIPGSYGLAVSGNSWVFAGSSDSQGKFTRQIVVADVLGSAIDQTDLKRVQSLVSWDISPGRQGSVALADYLTDWGQSQGAAGQLSLDISSTGLAKGNRDLIGMKIENTELADIVIDKITIWWDNSRLVEEIRIAGATVWSSSGPGLPAGSQPSGTELDIDDFLLAAGSGQYEIDAFSFSGSMKNAVFMVLFRMADGSTKYALVEPGAVPPPSCPQDQSSFFLVDTTGANVGGGGRRDLRRIDIENTDPNCPITIDKITVSWDAARLVEEIRIAGTTVWSESGPGLPAGSQPSGTELDIDDFLLAAGSGSTNIDRIRFDGNMSGATFEITFLFSDGSIISTGSFSP